VNQMKTFSFYWWTNSVCWYCDSNTVFQVWYSSDQSSYYSDDDWHEFDVGALCELKMPVYLWTLHICCRMLEK